MAFSATRRLSTASPAATLSSLFGARREKLQAQPRPPRPPPEDGKRQRATRTPRPQSRPRPRPLPRQPMVEEASALLRRLREGNYLRGEDLSAAPQAYSPDLVKAAAERFGHDHQMVAKWLSGSDLKKVALFGCPSVERRTVFASKRLRAFFNIQEDKICSSCKIKSSCKFVNQRVLGQNKVILSDTMRIITLFVLDAVPQELQVPAELKASVSKLLKDTLLIVLKLGKLFLVCSYSMLLKFTAAESNYLKVLDRNEVQWLEIELEKNLDLLHLLAMKLGQGTVRFSRTSAYVHGIE